MTEQLRLRGHLKGHGDWVTQIATSPSQPDMILSSSRGVRVGGGGGGGGTREGLGVSGCCEARMWHVIRIVSCGVQVSGCSGGSMWPGSY